REHTPEIDTHLQLADPRDLLHRTAPEDRVDALRVQRPGDRERDVRGGQRRPVREADALAEVEDDALVVLRERPARREARPDLSLRTERRYAVVDLEHGRDRFLVGRVRG